MIYGVGVGAKYSTIIDGRRLELERLRIDNASDQLMEFKQTIQQATLSEFEEWYQLYQQSRLSTSSCRKIKALQQYEDEQ